LAVRDELDIPLPAMAPSYRPSARRRDTMDPATKRLAIFASVIGACLLGLVAAWAFTGHHRSGVPVIEAASGPVKTKPANPGGLQVAGANESILSGEGDGKETVAPGPETPAPQALKAEQAAAEAAATPATPAAQPEAAAEPAEPKPLPPLKQHVAARPATTAPPGSTSTEGGASVRLIPGAKPPGPVASREPPPPVRPGTRAPLKLVAPALLAHAATTAAAAQEAPPAQTTPMQPSTATPGAVQSTPLPAPDAQTVPPPTAPSTMAAPAPPAPAAEPPAVAPAAAAPAHMAPNAHGRRPLVQFAAVGSGEAALAEWQRLEKKYPDLLGGHTPNITKTEHDGKTFWRIRTGGFSDLTAAAVFCQKVKSRGGNCVATF
jgi:hypothetical protein